MHLPMAKQVRALAVAAIVLAAGAGASAASATTYISQFNHIAKVASAVPFSGPAKGDVNPYGVAVVHHGAGKLVSGDVLVSNFNNAMNEQGTGSSIMQISPSGMRQVFAVVPPPTATLAVGLTTALAVLPHDMVIVGSLPAPGGNSANATAGALTVLNDEGQVVDTITAPDINGPWDLTATGSGSTATVYVTNVLNGTVAAGGKVVHMGTVVRLDLQISSAGVTVSSNTVIGSGFAEHTDPNALVVGPTGVGLGRDGTLYVADSDNNRIASIADAPTRTTAVMGGGTTVTSGEGLNDPLGLLIAPNGDIVSANGANGNIVETSPAGTQLAAKTLVPNGGGDLFGLALVPHGMGIYWVNDIGSGPMANSLDVLN